MSKILDDYFREKGITKQKSSPLDIELDDDETLIGIKTKERYAGKKEKPIAFLDRTVETIRDDGVYMEREQQFFPNDEENSPISSPENIMECHICHRYIRKDNLRESTDGHMVCSKCRTKNGKGGYEVNTEVQIPGGALLFGFIIWILLVLVFGEH